MKVQETNRCKIKQLFDAGITKASDIAKRLAIPERTFYRVLKTISAKKSLGHKKGAGRPHKLVKADRNRIMALVQHNPRITLNECRAKLSTQVAKSTLRGNEEESTTISSGGQSSGLVTTPYC